MKISIITVFPEIYESFFKVSLISRAIKKDLVTFHLVRFSDLCEPKGRIDQPTCGHGVGMIIKPEVVQKAIETCENKWGNGFKIFFTPQGKKLNQRIFKKLANKFFSLNIKQQDANGKNKEKKFDHLILVCSRYEGIDARVEGYYADLLISIGDYVVMGGDLPAQVFLEGLLRFLPGVVGKQESVEKESFMSSFLDYPEYGLPAEWKNLKIPEVILSGNHALIERWREEQSVKKTIENRFDWFISSNPSKKDIELCRKNIPNHYVALMHSQVLVKSDQIGNTSITSLDIHDISRSCATYGIENYFVVTKLEDQQKILNTFLDFWRSDDGKEYNLSRFEAVKRVLPAFDLDEVLKKIEEKEKKKPLIICTSARFSDQQNVPLLIDYFSQSVVWKEKRPVLFVLGTGHGLSEHILKRSDFFLQPIKGLTDYNHLSVRSAAAIILDRWLGVNFKDLNNLDI